MALKSSLVTAPAGSTVRSYLINDSDIKASPNDLRVEETKARKYYERVVNNYVNLKSLYNQLGTIYMNCANNVMTDPAWKSTLKKTANKCIDQGKHCKDRKEKLESVFVLDELRAEVARLREAQNKDKANDEA